MDIRKINDQISVAPQVTAAEAATLKAEGFGSVICNRPDGEEPGQPLFEDVAESAQSAGLQTLLLPISGGMMTAQDVAQFAAALREMPGPVLAYCRSGTRSTMLWAASQAGTLDRSEIVSSAAAAGYDISGIV